MPREFALISTKPIGVEAVAAVAGAANPRLGLRTLFGGWAVQLLDAGDTGVLTIEVSRWLETPPAQHAGDCGDGGVWWTEASAPWGSAGAQGAQLVRALASNAGAELITEDDQ
ncbi:MAG: hypothetical protein L0G99_01215 [Propionibacteriales bacterium]|nr:hypothetical protein [Propionibacteriales bacterium]